LDEFFDIEKDTETFTTALLTALILNGGKALTIKIKGKKTTVTAEAVEKCIDKDGNLDTKKLVNLKNGQSNNKGNVGKEYVDNIQEYSAKGITIEEYLQKNGINIVDNNTKLSAAVSLGDSKLYILSCVEEILNNKKLSNSKRKNLNDLLDSYKKIPVGNLNTETMLKSFKKYLSKEQIEKVNNIKQNGMSDKLASSYTDEQLAAVFNYTACGGLEINAWLNDANEPKAPWDSSPDVKTRDIYHNISEIQDVMSGHYDQSKDRYNRIFDSSQGNIIDCLDSVISSANYDKAIVSYRGIKELFDNNVKIDVQGLKIGDSFESAGYQSSSVVMENCYGVKRGDTNIILKIIVPPNSGTGAYIENITGVNDYNQMEMIIKRDAKMTVVGDLEYVEINGMMKTIVPVMVE